MKTRNLFSLLSKVLSAGLFVLAGVILGTGTALGQMQDPCPLPPGTTPAPDPSVTAQQVEDGSASLQDFALGARDQFKRVTGASVQQAYHFGCLIRQDGGPWRSGSTYLVQLTLDGRVFVHSEDMTLSGNLINRGILATILVSLGVSPADLANPAAIVNTLRQEPHAPFDATTPIPGQRPGIAGAKGYVSAYNRARQQTPILLLAGFDLDASHLAQEPIDYGDPTITARDVVDRRTLKAFVTAAGNYFLELQKTGGREAISTAKVAMRDPNGPWRHGSVYLYVLDRNSNIILFHGAFPNRFELRPLIPTQRDAVTGELILPQVLTAAASSPEGGFVEYFFDDPNDDTDDADIPKVGYAREFRVLRADGSVSPNPVVIGSGFYPASHAAASAQPTQVVETLLPQVMRAMTANTVDAISGRIQAANSGAPPAAGFSLAGASSLSDLLLANARGLGSGTLDPGRLLADSSFTLSLDGTGAGGGYGSMSFWGSGDYRGFSGDSAQTLDYDGSVLSAHLGVDTRMGRDLLAGVSLGLARGEVDYTDLGVLTGELSTSLTSVHPYLGWQSPGGIGLWAALGHGRGDVEVNEPSLTMQRSDLTQQMAAVGVSGPLVEGGGMIAGGTTSLRLKGEAAFTRTEVEGSATLSKLELDVSRVRLVMEGSHVRKLESGGTLTPSVELGTRYDGGDGETGSGIEAGGGVRYHDPASGWTVEGRARVLLHHNGDYKEWGVGGLVKLDPGTAGRGLSLSVRPVWGQAVSGVERLWESGVALGAAADPDAARMHARIAYGIGTATWAGHGVLTPYTDVSLSGDGANRLGIGSRLDIGSSVRMSLEGVHSRPAGGEADHSIMLRGALYW